MKRKYNVTNMKKTAEHLFKTDIFLYGSGTSPSAYLFEPGAKLGRLLEVAV